MPTRFRLAGGWVHRIDNNLGSAASRPVSLPPDASLRAATPDLRHIVAVHDGVLFVLGNTDIRVELGADADTATFLSQDRLLVSVPNVETAAWQGRTYQQRTTHRLLLFDGTGRFLDGREIPDILDAGVSAFPHPVDGSTLLEFGMGQDGSHIYLVSADGDRIMLRHLHANVVICGFSPDGERLLVLPHASYMSNPTALRWPDLALSGETTIARAGLPETAAFDHYGCYLSADRVLLKTYEHGLLLGDRNLDAIASVLLAGTPPIGDGFDIDTILGVSPRRFAAALWQHGQHRATLCDLPR